MISYESFEPRTVKEFLTPHTGVRSKAAPAGSDDDLPPLLSVLELMAQKRTSADIDRFRGQVVAIKANDTRTLIVRVATTTDPLVLWAIHIALTARGIPPAQRWPANTTTEQHKFITWLADLHWFHKQNPDHRPKFKSWQRFMQFEPLSSHWHTFAHLAYRQLSHTVSYGSTLALALTPAQRIDSVTLITDTTNRNRRSLQPKHFEVVRQALIDSAHAHPDLSGKLTPEASATRRAGIWRIYILTGRNKTETARIWQLITGEQLARQSVSVMLKKIAVILNDATEK